MEEKIIKYLREKYDARGIILYGSRAEGSESLKSDWDLFIFTDKNEEDVEDFAEFNKFEGESLEVSPLPITTLDSSNFILETAMHPIKEARVLYDNTDGLIEKILENTKTAYKKGPEVLTSRKKDLYRKILNKFILKIESRPDNAGYILFGLGFFYMHAIRYWFEERNEWPLNIHEAETYIQKKDTDFYKLLRAVHTPESSYNEKLAATKEIRDILFPLK